MLNQAGNQIPDQSCERSIPADCSDEYRAAGQRALTARHVKLRLGYQLASDEDRDGRDPGLVVPRDLPHRRRHRTVGDCRCKRQPHFATRARVGAFAPNGHVRRSRLACLFWFRCFDDASGTRGNHRIHDASVGRACSIMAAGRAADRAQIGRLSIGIGGTCDSDRSRSCCVPDCPCGSILYAAFGAELGHWHGALQTICMVDPGRLQHGVAADMRRDPP